MHTVAHLLTGFLWGEYKGGSLHECTVLALCALIVDIEAPLLEFFGCLPLWNLGYCGFDHAVLTHTGAYQLPIGLVLCGIFWCIHRFDPLLTNQDQLPTKSVVTVTNVFLMLVSHLVLDTVTFNKSPDCETQFTHRYLWPATTLGFHINCLIPPASDNTAFLIRAVWEWALYHPFLWVWVWYRMSTAMERKHCIDSKTGKVEWSKSIRARVALVLLCLVTPIAYAIWEGFMVLPSMVWLFSSAGHDLVKGRNVNRCAISPEPHGEGQVVSEKEGKLISQSLGKAVSEVELSEAKHQIYLEDSVLPAVLTRMELEAGDSREAVQSPAVWEVETPQTPEPRASFARNPASPQPRGHTPLLDSVRIQEGIQPRGHTPLLSSSEAIMQHEDARSPGRLDVCIDCPALDIDLPALDINRSARDIELERRTSSVLDLCQHLDPVNYQ